MHFFSIPSQHWHFMKCILIQRFPSASVLWALTMTAWSHTFSWGWPGTREALCCWTSPEMCSTARWYSSLAKLQGKSTGVTAGLHSAVLITRLAHKLFPGSQGGGDVERSCQLPMGMQGMKSRLCLGQGWQCLVLPRNHFQTSSAFQTAGPGPWMFPAHADLM